jgi:Domain of unknown function (DUF1843)
MSGSQYQNPVRALYAVPIHQCIAKGDLGEMKAMVKEAEQYIGDVSKALEALKAEVAKKGK